MPGPGDRGPGDRVPGDRGPGGDREFRERQKSRRMEPKQFIWDDFEVPPRMYLSYMIFTGVLQKGSKVTKGTLELLNLEIKILHNILKGRLQN